LLVVPFRGVARAGVAALAFTLGALAVSPYLAYNHLWFHDPDAGHYRQVAAAVSRLSSKRPLITGSVEIVSGLSFYLPERHIANLNALADHRADISMNGLIIVCLEEDAVCRAITTEMDVIVKTSYSLVNFWEGWDLQKNTLSPSFPRVRPLHLEMALNERLATCPYRKSDPGILMMQSAQNRTTENASGCLGGA
jgi:hypothetical protein